MRQIVFILTTKYKLIFMVSTLFVFDAKLKYNITGFQHHDPLLKIKQLETVFCICKSLAEFSTLSNTIKYDTSAK